MHQAYIRTPHLFILIQKGVNDHLIQVSRDSRGGLHLSAAKRVLALAMLAEKTIERLLLTNREFARLDTRVVYTEQGIDVVHRLSANIRELFDLSSDILDLHRDSKSVYEPSTEEDLNEPRRR